MAWQGRPFQSPLPLLQWLAEASWSLELASTSPVHTSQLVPPTPPPSWSSSSLSCLDQLQLLSAILLPQNPSPPGSCREAEGAGSWSAPLRVPTGLGARAHWSILCSTPNPSRLCRAFGAKILTFLPLSASTAVPSTEKAPVRVLFNRPLKTKSCPQLYGFENPLCISPKGDQVLGD